MSTPPRRDARLGAFKNARWSPDAPSSVYTVCLPLRARGSVFWLLVISALIALVCNGLVHAIDGAARSTGLSDLFFAGVLLPLVNNAPQTTVAVRAAWNGKIDFVVALIIVAHRRPTPGLSGVSSARR